MKRNFTTAIRVFRLFCHFLDLNTIYRFDDSFCLYDYYILYLLFFLVSPYLDIIILLDQTFFCAPRDSKNALAIYFWASKKNLLEKKNCQAWHFAMCLNFSIRNRGLLQNKSRYDFCFIASKCWVNHDIYSIKMASRTLLTTLFTLFQTSIFVQKSTLNFRTQKNSKNFCSKTD